MSRNKNLGILSAALLAVLISVPAFAPRAYAQNTYKSLHSFDFAGGTFPEQLIMDQAGNLYGAAGQGGGSVIGGDTCGDEGCGLVYKLAANSDGSWTETVLYRFCSLKSCADGGLPFSPLIFDQAGNLYGETYGGGLYEDGGVFELSPNSDGTWTEKVLYNFTGGADGGSPIGGLIFDQAGNLYGTTYEAGAGGYGVVFRLTPNAGGSWTEKVLHDFTFGADGGLPFAGVIIDQAGNLYGTTSYGGDTGCGNSSGCGVVFELTPTADGSWKEKVLHTFANTPEGGGFPGAGLVLDQAGNLYGTTEQGGDPSQCDGQAVGCGIVFELTPDAGGGWEINVLHHFTGGRDGGNSFAGLTFDRAGNLYGTAAYGGNLNYCTTYSGGCGVVFKLTPNPKASCGWNYTVVHRFIGQPGAHPATGVIFDTAGNLYGTTSGDGDGDVGSVFEITP